MSIASYVYLKTLPGNSVDPTLVGERPVRRDGGHCRVQPTWRGKVGAARPRPCLVLGAWTWDSPALTKGICKKGPDGPEEARQSFGY